MKRIQVDGTVEQEPIEGIKSIAQCIAKMIEELDIGQAKETARSIESDVLKINDSALETEYKTLMSNILLLEDRIQSMDPKKELEKRGIRQLPGVNGAIIDMNSTFDEKCIEFDDDDPILFADFDNEQYTYILQELIAQLKKSVLAHFQKQKNGPERSKIAIATIIEKIKRRIKIMTPPENNEPFSLIYDQISIINTLIDSYLNYEDLSNSARQYDAIKKELSAFEEKVNNVTEGINKYEKAKLIEMKDRIFAILFYLSQKKDNDAVESPSPVTR